MGPSRSEEPGPYYPRSDTRTLSICLFSPITGARRTVPASTGTQREQTLSVVRWTHLPRGIPCSFPHLVDELLHAVFRRRRSCEIDDDQADRRTQPAPETDPHLERSLTGPDEVRQSIQTGDDPIFVRAGPPERRDGDRMQYEVSREGEVEQEREELTERSRRKQKCGERDESGVIFKYLDNCFSGISPCMST